MYTYALLGYRSDECNKLIQPSSPYLKNDLLPRRNKFLNLIQYFSRKAHYLFKPCNHKYRLTNLAIRNNIKLGALGLEYTN